MQKLRYIFLNFLLKIKTLLQSSKNKKNKSNITPESKVSMNSAALLNFVSETEKIRAEVEELAEKIVMQFKNDTDKTLEILKKKKVKVYRTRFAVKILQNIGEKQGFITPLKGFKALYLNFVFGLICDKKLVISTKTQSVFVFNKNHIDPYFLSAQIYKWVAMRKKMGGFEFSVQEKFKKLYNKMTESEINKLSANEIFAIKEAIARESEASDFALKLHSEQKIKSDN